MRIWPNNGVSLSRKHTTTAGCFAKRTPKGPTRPWVGLRLGVFRLRESTLEYLDRLKGGGPQGVSNVLTDYMGLTTGMRRDKIWATQRSGKMEGVGDGVENGQ